MSGVKILCSFLFVRKISLVSDGNKIAKTKNSPLRGQVLTGAYQFFLVFWKGPCFFVTFVFYLLYLYLSKNSTSIIKEEGGPCRDTSRQRTECPLETTCQHNQQSRSVATSNKHVIFQKRDTSRLQVKF